MAEHRDNIRTKIRERRIAAEEGARPKAEESRFNLSFLHIDKILADRPARRYKMFNDDTEFLKTVTLS
ncbi:hypothetical protein Q1695_003940 [Nippostrongylus brasiliensis]|nr:hypothetical protein Q1695_003940 [Nippostrongylus brasiliensis]